MIQPFKAFLDLEESIKESWAKEYGGPPYGHAEESKLKVFCNKMGIDTQEAVEILTKKGFNFSQNDTLLKIAQQNNTTPNHIYALINEENVDEKTHNDDSSVPSKLGRKTLKDLDQLKKIDLDKAIDILKQKGLSDVDEDSKMKKYSR